MLCFFKIEEKLVLLYNCIFRSNICTILKLITMKDKAGWKINLTHKESLKNLNKLPFKKPDIKNWYMAV